MSEKKDMETDEGKEVTEKEKENTQQDEKEKDTSNGDKAQTEGETSPSPNKLGTTSSRSSRAGTPKGKSPKPSAGKKGKGEKGKRSASPKGKKGKKKEEEKKPETPVADQEEEEGLPEGVIPLFLASKTQEIFGCRADEDVTEDNPYRFLSKEDVLQDLHNRAAVSDWSVVKEIIVEYPEEDIVICYDADFKHGQNFLLATTPDAKEKLLNPKKKKGEGEEAEEAEEIVYKYVPPVSKPWVTHGSEHEVAEESLVENRSKINVSIRRVRRAFGAPVTFTDRNVSQAKDAYIECTPYEDKAFDLTVMELDKGTQAIPIFKDSAAQTDWKYPRNAAVQYQAREFDADKKKEVQESITLNMFMKEIATRFELAMQQNEIMDVFVDDWEVLADQDSAFGSKADNHLKEYQSFTDLQFSQDKTVTAIDWHPTMKGIVAVSCAEKMSFDDRVDNSAKIIMTPSLILIWSFTDPIHPQLLLEAPDDIYSFKFCPTDPNIIAGGCANGQVVMWDITQYADRLKVARSSHKKKTITSMFETDDQFETPVVRYCAVSSIEMSHRAIITDIQWVPDHMELNRMGVPHENKSKQCVQLISCAADNSLLVWDTRAPKTPNVQEKKDDHSNNPMGIPTTFKHLDLTWKPVLKIHLSKSEPGGDHAPLKFSIQERQGDSSILKEEEEEEQKGDSKSDGFQFNKPGSAAAKRPLKKVQTRFYCGTEDGEVVYVDWMPQKDSDSGKIQTPKPDFYHILHDGPVVAMQRSPFFKDILLVVGGWTFTIWKEGVESGPILMSSAATKKLTSAHWSPTRPAVFYITREDGTVDIWDLLDRTHEPSMNQSVTPSPITCIFPYEVTSKQHLLAVGDSSGTLHILEIPWSLKRPSTNEQNGVYNYFEREVKRRGFVVERWDFREKEKMELEAEAKKKAGGKKPVKIQKTVREQVEAAKIAPNVILSEDEIEYRMKLEYEDYLAEENAFLKDLGLIKEEEEPLPTTD